MSALKTLSHLVNHPLNRSNRLAAVVNFARWQAGCKLLAGSVVFDWINGSKFIACRGETGVTGNIYCGLHEFQEMAFLLHTLRDSDLFVDIGANVGSWTILACAAVGANSYCFEPVPSTFQKLMMNIRLNDIDGRVVPSNIALGNCKDYLYFSSDQNCMNHVLAEGEHTKNSILVKVSTLDDELPHTPFLMKIDVEGYEYPALEGAKATLKNDALCGVIMELNGSGEKLGFDESQIMTMMHDFGFRTYFYDPFHRKLECLKGKNNSQGNTIFVRDLDRIVERIINAPKFHVKGLAI